MERTSYGPKHRCLGRSRFVGEAVRTKDAHVCAKHRTMTMRHACARRHRVGASPITRANVNRNRWSLHCVCCFQKIVCKSTEVSIVGRRVEKKEFELKLFLEK